jgi:hypothetical protein
MVTSNRCRLLRSFLDPLFFTLSINFISFFIPFFSLSFRKLMTSRSGPLLSLNSVQLSRKHAV